MAKFTVVAHPFAQLKSAYIRPIISEHTRPILRIRKSRKNIPLKIARKKDARKTARRLSFA